MPRISFEKSSGNVFADIGFTPAEAEELTAKSTLIIAIKDIIQQRKLTQQEAARLYGADQPTLSKVLRGRMESVTIDRHGLAQRPWAGCRDHRQTGTTLASPRSPSRNRSRVTLVGLVQDRHRARPAG